MYIIVPSQLRIPENVKESVTYTGEASVANPMNLTKLEGPYKLTIDREYKGVGTAKNGDVVIIEEKAEVKVDSPMVPTQKESFKLAVNRETCEHLDEDGDDWDFARQGHFVFGIRPEKKDLEFWLHDINDTVIAKYEGTKTYEGISVIEYTMKDTQPVIKNQALIKQYSAMAYYFGSSNLNELYFEEDSVVYVDELSGMIVYIQRNVEFTADITYLPTNESRTVTLSKMSYEFDDETSKEMIQLAKDTDFQIHMFEIFLPIIYIMMGVAILITSIVLHKRWVKKQTETTQALPQHQQPTPVATVQDTQK